jgi:hypothetical protein
MFAGAGGMWNIREAESLRRDSRWSLIRPIVSDAFTASNGTALSARSPNVLQPGASGWQNQFGTAAITGNQACFTSYSYYGVFGAHNTGLATVNANTANCVVRSRVKWGDNGYGYGFGGLILRYQDSNNFLVALSDYAATNCAKFIVAQVQNGSVSILADSTTRGSCLGGRTGQTGEICIAMNGSAIYADFIANISNAVTHTFNFSSNVGLSATRHGIYTIDIHGNARWDDFSVQPFRLPPLTVPGAPTITNAYYDAANDCTFVVYAFPVNDGGTRITDYNFFFDGTLVSPTSNALETVFVGHGLARIEQDYQGAAATVSATSSFGQGPQSIPFSVS